MKKTHAKMSQRRKQGIVFNVQRFSIHDGPGIRTAVFFKGCNLQCLWCHNPESISCMKQVEFNRDKCIQCGNCFLACPQNAHFIDDDGKHQIDRLLCDGCFRCCDVCYAEALVGVGKYYGVDELMKSILADKLYFDQSGGGVTFSGGEPMLQVDFLKAVLKTCKSHGIHTAVDTAGNVPWESFEAILADTDLFLYDVKTMDPDKHQSLTGVGNAKILDNLTRLAASGKKIIVRSPLIAGFNDEEYSAIGEFMAKNNLQDIEIIPFHKLGYSKYEALDLENEVEDVETPSEQVIEEVLQTLRSHGLNAEQS